MVKRLALESLELHILLAADVALRSSGELLITGDDLANVVKVFQAGHLMMVDGGDDGSHSFPASAINRIRFLGRRGDDQFTNNTLLPTVAYGNQGNDKLVGGSGADRMYGGPDNDCLIGNGGDDELHGDHGNDLLAGGDGNDAAYGWFGDDTLLGDAGNDYLSGYEGNDVLRGGSGNDALHGHEGNDRLFGEDGDDELLGWTGNDLLVGGDGNDYLSGWGGNDLLIGGKGDDRLRGHAGRDFLIGGKDPDQLDGGSGQDIVVGGWTKYDDQLDALDRVLSNWSLDDPFELRVSRLSAGIDGIPALSKWGIKVDGKPDVFIRDLVDTDWQLVDHKDLT